jgi:hypothetical protein
LEPRLADDKKKLRDNYINKGKEVKMILKDLAIGDYEQFKFFHA